MWWTRNEPLVCFSKHLNASRSIINRLGGLPGHIHLTESGKACTIHALKKQAVLNNLHLWYYATWFVHHNEFAEKDSQRQPQTECQYRSPGLEEKISREAIDSLLHKLSICMIVHTAKAACTKHSWVWFFDNMKYFWPGTCINTSRFKLCALFGGIADHASLGEVLQCVLLVGSWILAVYSAVVVKLTSWGCRTASLHLPSICSLCFLGLPAIKRFAGLAQSLWAWSVAHGHHTVCTCTRMMPTFITFHIVDFKSL